MTYDDAIRELKRNPNARITVEMVTQGDSDAEVEAAEARVRPKVEQAWREASRSARGLAAAFWIVGAYIVAVSLLYGFGLAVVWLTTLRSAP